MINFMTMSDEEVLKYIDDNFHLFAKQRSEDFPAYQLEGLRQGSIAIVRREEGFAMVFTWHPFFCKPTDLMFLHVLPEFRGRSIGKDIIKQVKSLAQPLVPVELTCETASRCDYFMRFGFTVTAYCEDDDLYKMVWKPE